MRKLSVFNNVTIDGYFTGANGDFSWAHSGPPDPEFDAFVAGNAESNGELLFGRVTYQLMAAFWPTPAAAQMNPVVAAGMNSMPKIVFSSTLERAEWHNTRVIRGGLATAVRQMKSEIGPDLVILGSGTLVAQLAQESLIDEYQLVVNPIAIGSGRTMFDGLSSPRQLKLASTRAFASGKLFNCYEPSR
ncbi:MAG: dihydrofolate reductase family protein [Gemmatimonadota bacterium]